MFGCRRSFLYPLPRRRRTRQLDRRQLGRGVDRAEDDLVVLDVGHDQLAGAEVTHEDLLGQHVLDLALDRAAQRPGAERGVVALVGEPGLGVLGELDVEVLGLQLAVFTRFISRSTIVFT